MDNELIRKWKYILDNLGEMMGHLTTNQGVVGSNPAGRASKTRGCRDATLFISWRVAQSQPFPLNCSLQVSSWTVDPRSRSGARWTGAHTSSPSPRIPNRPAPARHATVCPPAHASSPRYAAGHADRSLRYPVRARDPHGFVSNGMTAHGSNGALKRRCLQSHKKLASIF